MLMAKTTKNDVVQSLTETREMLEMAYNQLKTAMTTRKYEDLKSLRKTMIEIIIRTNAVIDAITELDVGDGNDGN